ncbi:MAG: DUF2807 domain-containing protein [Muribaculaceae bacterium]|nr:hypothetical protein [Bacteroides sp.]MDE6843847.1 DUF2807 domain-containing protein [Muribaculaceae bacterium]
MKFTTHTSSLRLHTALKALLFLVVSLTVFGTAQAQKLNDYRLEVGQFDKLKVTDNVNVIYRCMPDSAGYIAYRSTEQFSDAFIFTLNKGTLRIQVSTEDVGAPDLPVVYVYSDFLTEVENSSDFKLTIFSPAPCPEFKAIQVGNGSIVVDDIRATKVTAALATGNGTLNLSGSCEQAVYRMVGVGMIEADMLRANSVSCKILGNGTIGCWPLQRLDVKGIGSTKIYYKGDPTVKKAGGGKLFQLRQNTTDSNVIDTIAEE